MALLITSPFSFFQKQSRDLLASETQNNKISIIYNKFSTFNKLKISNQSESSTNSTINCKEQLVTEINHFWTTHIHNSKKIYSSQKCKREKISNHFTNCDSIEMCWMIEQTEHKNKLKAAQKAYSNHRQPIGSVDAFFHHFVLLVMELFHLILFVAAPLSEWQKKFIHETKK